MAGIGEEGVKEGAALNPLSRQRPAPPPPPPLPGPAHLLRAERDEADVALWVPQQYGTGNLGI